MKDSADDIDDRSGRRFSPDRGIPKVPKCDCRSHGAPNLKRCMYTSLFSSRDTLLACTVLVLWVSNASCEMRMRVQIFPRFAVPVALDQQNGSSSVERFRNTATCLETCPVCEIRIHIYRNNYHEDGFT